MDIKSVQAKYAMVFYSKWKCEKLAVVVHVPRTTQNMVISRPCFAEDGIEMYKKQTCTATVLLNIDVLDVIVVVVCLSGPRKANAPTNHVNHENRKRKP